MAETRALTCIPCQHRTFMLDVRDDERRALFLEWLQTCVVGKHIVWQEQGGPNMGVYQHWHAGRVRGIEPDEPRIVQDEGKAPTLWLVGVTGRVWANGAGAIDGEHLYSFAEVEADEYGYVDLNQPLEWQHFGDWLREEKDIYWHCGELMKPH